MHEKEPCFFGLSHRERMHANRIAYRRFYLSRSGAYGKRRAA